MTVKTSYTLFHSLRLHFTSNQYDYFLYKGKTKNVRMISSNVFNLFESLKKNYKEDLFGFYVANLLEDPKIWVDDLFTDQSKCVFLDWKKRVQALTFNFKSDIISLNDEEPIKHWFRGENPFIFMKVLKSEINFESFCILHNLLWVNDKSDNNFGGNFLWKSLDFKSQKYYPFLQYDKEKILGILKETIK